MPKIRKNYLVLQKVEKAHEDLYIIYHIIVIIHVLSNMYVFVHFVMDSISDLHVFVWNVHITSWNVSPLYYCRCFIDVRGMYSGYMGMENPSFCIDVFLFNWH